MGQDRPDFVRAIRTYLREKIQTGGMNQATLFSTTCFLVSVYVSNDAGGDTMKGHQRRRERAHCCLWSGAEN